MQSQRRKCGAKKRNGEPCKAWAIIYGTRCRMHGGSSPKAKVKAAERRQIAEAEQELTRLGGAVPLVRDPVQEFRLAISRAKHMEQILWERADEAEPGSVDAYTASLDRLTKFIESFTRLGLEARLVSLEEDQGKLVADAVLGLLADLEKLVVDELGHAGQVRDLFHDQARSLARARLQALTAPAQA